MLVPIILVVYGLAIKDLFVFIINLLPYVN